MHSCFYGSPEIGEAPNVLLPNYHLYLTPKASSSGARDTFLLGEFFFHMDKKASQKAPVIAQQGLLVFTPSWLVIWKFSLTAYIYLGSQRLIAGISYRSIKVEVDSVYSIFSWFSYILLAHDKWRKWWRCQCSSCFWMFPGVETTVSLIVVMTLRRIFCLRFGTN